MAEDAWILGIHMTKFGKHPDKDTVDLASEAVMGALADGGVTMKDIGVIGAGNLMGGGHRPDRSRSRSARRASPSTTWPTPVPPAPPRCGWRSWRSRRARSTAASRSASRSWPAPGSWPAAAGRPTPRRGPPRAGRARWRPLDGRIGTDTMPGVFAQIGMEYGHKYGGASFELFAQISEKNHAHSTLNPLASYQKRMTLEEIMNDVMIAYPNTRPMCSANCDGAAAAVVVSDSKLKTLSAEQRRRAVKISASVLTTDPWEEACQVLPNVNTLTRNAARAGLRAGGGRSRGPRPGRAARLLRHGRAGALRQPDAVRRGRRGRLLQERRHVA